MILQPILFPSEEYFKETSLYYRGSETIDTNKIHLSPNQQIEFNTYFNSFSIDKWKTYTVITNLFLEIDVEGEGSISLYESYLSGSSIQTKLLHSQDFSGESRISVNFPDIKKLRGACYFTITAKRKGCSILGGHYGTNLAENDSNQIKLGIGICTYKREKDVSRNLNAICESILDNQNSPLHKKLEIFIADNGQTLNNSNIHHNNIRIFPNKNTGGSGGFARCMIEAVKANQDLGITNFILMDDDIVLNPAVLLRTYHFLQFAKPEYQDRILGGTMLKLEEPGIQGISGCFWDADTGVSFCNSNFDLRNFANVVKNEEPNKANFNPWFYCCIPIQHIRNDNLPLPFFFQYDDTEYGLRHKSPILLNGIMVWHSFEDKANICRNYCSRRNAKITKILNHSTDLHLTSKRDLLIQCINLVGTYRYLDWIALSQAEIDLRTGPSKLMDKHIIRFYQKLIKTKYPQITATTSPTIQSSKKQKWNIVDKISFSFALFNTILPSFKKPVFFSKNDEIQPQKASFTKQVIIQQSMESSFIYTKSLKKLALSLFLLLKLVLCVTKKDKDIREMYFKKRKEMANIDFWNQYLGI